MSKWEFLEQILVQDMGREKRLRGQIVFEVVFVFVHVFVFLVLNKVYLPEVCLTDVGRENRWRGQKSRQIERTACKPCLIQVEEIFNK